MKASWKLIFLLLLNVNSMAFDKDLILDDYFVYKKSYLDEFNNYKRINKEEYQKFKKEVKKYWDVPELSSQKVWVQYSSDFQQKSRVDFEHGIITISRIQSPSSPKVSIKKTVEKLLSTTKKQAFENDQLAQSIESRTLKEVNSSLSATLSSQPVFLGHLFNAKKNIKATVQALLNNKTVTRDKNKKGKQVVTVSIPINPEQSTLKKSQPSPTSSFDIKSTAYLFKKDLLIQKSVPYSADKLPNRARPIATWVQKHALAQSVPIPLIFALVEAESSFNPMAKSHIPAYGLMQIVPTSAGKDASKRIFGEMKVLTPSYLYHSEKNIQMGAAYLHILFYQYLKSVENPVSRLYCTIAAYNTGAGNVARAFTGKTNIHMAAKKINQLAPDQVYSHLIKHLPYKETKNYLKKVNRLLSIYHT